jgi:DNA-binding winged helix-turn-helix (wHTH) protein
MQGEGQGDAGHTVDKGPLVIGEVKIDCARREVYRGGDRVSLPPTPFEVLNVLIQNSGRIVSKNELLATVWGQAHKDKNTVEQAIRQIRVALGDDADHPRFIRTVPRQGYCFVLPDKAPALSAEPRPPRLLRKHYFYLAAAFLVILGIGLAWFFRSRTPVVPARVSFSADSVRAFSADGRLLWSHRFAGTLALDSSGPASVARPTDLVRIADLRGDGSREVLLVAVIQATTGLPEYPRLEVDCFSSTGALLWSYTPSESFRFGMNELTGGWGAYDIRVSGTGREQSVYVALSHGQWGNSFVVQIDAESGMATIRFVNTGVIRALNEILTPNASYLLVGGFNNEYDGGSLAFVDERKAFAASPQTTGTRHKCATCPPGEPDYYFVFPRSELNRLRKVYETPVIGAQGDGDRLDVSKRETDDGAQTRYVMRPFPLIERAMVRFDSPYEMIHRELEQSAGLSHALAACPDCLHPPPVRAWTPGGGWRQLPVKCTE